MNRLFQNYITSLIGLAVILYTTYHWMQLHDISWEQVVAQYTIGFLLLRAKDSLLWMKPK